MAKAYFKMDISQTTNFQKNVYIEIRLVKTQETHKESRNSFHLLKTSGAEG